jgi:Uma2 family endonuclease
MSVVTAEARYKPEDLLTLPDMDSFELVDGQLVERNIGAKSVWVGGQLITAMNNHIHLHKLGWVWPSDASYQCFPDDPEKVRRPDGSFIRLGRLPGEVLPRGHIEIVPDLALEVVSPNDLFSEVEEKVEEYLGAGVRLVWVIDPELRRGWVYRPGGARTALGENDAFDGEDVLPGFRCRLGDVLPTATPNQNGPEAKPY